MQVNDALAFEYQSNYGTAWRNLDVTDLINNPGANGVCRVLGLRFEKKRFDLLGLKVASLPDDGTNPLLIRSDTP